MKTLVSVLLILAAACSTQAGDLIVNENFDSLNLDQLPPGWSRAQPGQLALVDEAGHGKVLKITNSDDHYPFVMATLEPGKATGKQLTISVAAKFPGTYVPKADNLQASPKLIFKALDPGSQVLVEKALVPQAGKPDWQPLKVTVNVPPEATNVSVTMCIEFVACEVFFDNFTIEVVGAAAAQAATTTPKAPVPPATNAAAKPPVETPKPPVANAKTTTPAPAPANNADKAPNKTLEDGGGILFGPNYVKALQKSFPAKDVNANLAMFIGPGFSEKEPAPKLPSAWKVVPPPVKVLGSQATPRAILASLPELLVKEKPEVVFISGDTAPGRKPTTTEADDWEDIAKLCMRLGAVPVMVAHPNENKKPPTEEPKEGKETKEELFDRIAQGIRKAMDVNSMLAVSAVPAETLGKRAGVLLKLLEVHVFLRVKADDPTKGPGKVTEE